MELNLRLVQDSQRYREGSASRALNVYPEFDKYIFIEKKRVNIPYLAQLKTKFPEKENKIEIQHGDANEKIQELCSRNFLKYKCRAVLFLDPFGMQVKWKTIEAVAQTKAIDLWLLVPIGVIVNRLLRKNGKIDERFRNRLDEFFGTNEWNDEFYKSIPSLFGDDSQMKQKIVSLQDIGEYFNMRLDTIFAGVAQSPGILFNSTNNPLYFLCFAVGNRNAVDVAIGIADDCLEKNCQRIRL